MALLALGGRRALARRRLHQPRLDPELAEPQPLVGLELDLGPGQQVVVAPPRVLEQIARELLLERALIALEPLPVAAREEDRVLVRDVDPLDARGLVGVHFLRQPARQLDRLHLGAEGAAEYPLDEAFDPTLEVAQDADRDAPFTDAGAVLRGGETG